jgi:hypothetical protein
MLVLVDESIYQPGVGTYVVGCVAITHADGDELRRELAQRAPFHFNTASDASRVAMLRRIGARRLLAIGYVYRGLYPIGREGAPPAGLVSRREDHLVAEALGGSTGVAHREATTPTLIRGLSRCPRNHRLRAGADIGRVILQWLTRYR